MVFSDPEIIESQLLAADCQLQVFVEALRQWFLRIVYGHDEHTQSETVVVGHWSWSQRREQSVDGQYTRM